MEPVGCTNSVLRGDRWVGRWLGVRGSFGTPVRGGCPCSCRSADPAHGASLKPYVFFDPFVTRVAYAPKDAAPTTCRASRRDRSHGYLPGTPRLDSCPAAADRRELHTLRVSELRPRRWHHRPLPRAGCAAACSGPRPTTLRSVASTTRRSSTRTGSSSAMSGRC